VGGQPGAIDSSGGAVATRWFGQSSFATYALATARNTVVVDAGLPLELLGPLGCGIQTGAGAVIRSLRVQAGDTIAVFGVGAVGLAAVMAAKAVGAGSIVAVDRHESRLALAEELGATHVVPAGDDVIDKVLAAAGGVHYSLDTTGVPGVIAQAVACLRPTGTCGLVAAQTGDLVLDPAALAVGRTVKGVLEGDSVPQSFIPFLINLWQRGRFPFERLIQTYPLDAINEAEHDALAGLTVKPVLVPHG
jgi:aryl-alcohol dehydrogenase